MPPGVLENLLNSVKMMPDHDLEARVLAGRAHNEDAVVITVPEGAAIVQTADVLAPIVNDAWAFGRIAAANAFSDVYAMGGMPWSALSLAFFPPALAMDKDDLTLSQILQGALDAMREAGAVAAGGHTVQDDELKFGLAVTGIIDPKHIARNDGLKAGYRLLLTKPLGTGILATAVKAKWEFAKESEAEIIRWCGQLNKAGAQVIQSLKLDAATDITGFGLGGHATEMALASNLSVKLYLNELPILPHTLEYARDGLIPAGSHANRQHFMPQTHMAENADEALVSIVFDAQTSGGLLLAMPAEKIARAREILQENGALAAEIGQVTPKQEKALILE